MTSIASDIQRTLPPSLTMTVLELALFMCIYRARRPLLVPEISALISEWFGVVIAPAAISAPVTRMIAEAWLVPDAGKVNVCAKGRDAARPLMEGIIRMLDQGTRLIDVALMLSVLRLTREELGGDHNPL